jgi:hypothetical protein
MIDKKILKIKFYYKVLIQIVELKGISYQVGRNKELLLQEQL